MPIPQVNDRIKEAPVVVLRAVFAGIGQILLTADKVRARAAEQVWTPERAPVRATAHLPAGRPAGEPPRNGVTWTEPAVADHSAVHEAPASQGPVTAATTPTAKATAKATPTAKTAKTAPAPRVAEPATEAPPLPGYDDLSLASLRARLRVLDAPAIQAMLGYEKAHARREPVITMLERRLAKISAG
jgi:hypothetical protein